MINNIVDYVIHNYDSRHMCLYSYLRMGYDFKKPLRCCFFWVYIIHFVNYVFKVNFLWLMSAHTSTTSNEITIIRRMVGSISKST